MNKRNSYISSGICLAAFLVLIVILKTVDVGLYEPVNTYIGLSRFNIAVHSFFGTNAAFFIISEALGYFSLFVAVVVLFGGAIGVFKARSFRGISKQHFYAMAAYAVLVFLYVLFDFAVVNCRPVLEAGQTVPESSFPSTHTMIAMIVMGVFARFVNKTIGVNKKNAMISAVCYAIAVVTVFARFLSGVHWATDILGSILISMAVIFAYQAVITDEK